MNQLARESVTFCRGCSFAVMEEGKQTGCKIRQMEPAEFFYAKDSQEYRVYKRLCQFKRDWGEFSDEMVEKVKDEVVVKYNCIINFKDKGLVEKTINSIKQQEIQPSTLILVCYQRYGDQAQELAQASGLKWVVHEIFDDVTDWRDEVIQKFPVQFNLFLNEGAELKPDYFSELNTKVNYEDLRFGCIQSERLLIFPIGLYKIVVSPIRVIIEEMKSLGLKILNEDFSTKE